MATLDMDFILSEEEAENLFSDTEIETPVQDKENENEDTTEEAKEDIIDTDSLFELPESVGSLKDTKQKKEDLENTTTENVDSPNTNFYSSYANAFKVDGVFQYLSDDDIKEVKDAESFVEAAEKEVRLRLDEALRRIYDALNAKIEPSVISQYENALKYLDDITEVNISDEGNDGEKLRANLIYQDFINRGFSLERAKKEVKRAFDSGNDIEYAKEALESNKQFCKEKYNNLIKEAQNATLLEKERQRKQNEELKLDILSSKQIYEDVELDTKTRLKIYDCIAKPVYKDPSTGEYLTPLEKYKQENELEFLKNIAFFYTMTDGFKNINNLVKGKVKKQVSKGIKDLEKILTTQPTPKEGNLRYMGGQSLPESFMNGKFKLDI